MYFSPNTVRSLKSRRLKWAGHIARMQQSTNAYRFLVGKPEVNRSIGRPRHRWEGNIKMDLREVGCHPREWIDLAEDRNQWRAYVRAVVLYGCETWSLTLREEHRLRVFETKCFGR